MQHTHTRFFEINQFLTMSHKQHIQYHWIFLLSRVVTSLLTGH